jgi:predicted deacylase
MGSIAPIESRTIEVPAAIDAGTQIPITTIRGAEPGPVLALIVGNHGYEYPPIIALQQFRTLVDPEKLRGTIVMVHVANMPSFLGRTIYFSPVDGKNPIHGCSQLRAQPARQCESSNFLCKG